jgi:hypothetical protein
MWIRTRREEQEEKTICGGKNEMRKGIRTRREEQDEKMIRRGSRTHYF